MLFRSAVAGALRALCSDPALRTAMGAAARARAETTFAYDTLVEALIPVSRGDLSGLQPLP